MGKKKARGPPRASWNWAGPGSLGSDPLPNLEADRDADEGREDTDGLGQNVDERRFCVVHDGNGVRVGVRSDGGEGGKGNEPGRDGEVEFVAECFHVCVFMCDGVIAR